MAVIAVQNIAKRIGCNLKRRCDMSKTDRYLFRGKTEEGKWVEGDTYGDIESGKTYIRSYGHSGGDGRTDPACDFQKDYEVIPETVGQYTGLKDKNGQKIFKADELRIIYKIGEYLFDGIYRVGFNYRGGEFIFNRLSWEDDGKNQFPTHRHLRADKIYNRWGDYENCVLDFLHNGDCVFCKDIEIIGNIHDNPELLTP